MKSRVKITVYGDIQCLISNTYLLIKHITRIIYQHGASRNFLVETHRDALSDIVTFCQLIYKIVVVYLLKTIVMQIETITHHFQQLDGTVTVLNVPLLAHRISDTGLRVSYTLRKKGAK